ncbi:MAG: HrpB1 family type III secretion system apparatus protein [Anaerolineae bacterium]|nr:HrpB1 family type III secretion system apparatus protein [Anaerolineae bacterium]
MSADWPDFNDLWDFGDPAGTEAVFRKMLPEADSTQDKAYQLQLQTQIARTLGLQKQFEAAHALLDRVEGEMQGGDVVEVRYLLERGRTLNTAKSPEKAVPLFHKAATLGEELGEDYYAVDALHMLGIAAPAEERLAWNLKAIHYAEGSTDEHAKNWLGSLYNNTGWALFDEKRYDEALAVFVEAQHFREIQGREGNIAIARWCVAKTLRVLGRVDEAMEILRELEAGANHDGFVDEELAECLSAVGKAEAAKPYCKKAFAALSQLDWVAEDKERMERLKTLGGG